MNQLQTSQQQVFETNLFFSELAEQGQRLNYIEGEELVHERSERE